MPSPCFIPSPQSVFQTDCTIGRALRSNYSLIHISQWVCILILFVFTDKSNKVLSVKGLNPGVISKVGWVWLSGWVLSFNKTSKKRIACSLNNPTFFVQMVPRGFFTVEFLCKLVWNACVLFWFSRAFYIFFIHGLFIKFWSPLLIPHMFSSRNVHVESFT